MPAPVGDHRTHKDGVLAVAQRRVRQQHDRGVLLHRSRFAGQRGLFHFQVDRFQQANVSRDEVAGFQKNHVAGHQLARGNGSAVPVAQHLGFRRGQLLQCRQGLFGAAFLDDAQHGVENDDRNNGDRINGFAEQG